jgi:hypothetical protein
MLLLFMHYPTQAANFVPGSSKVPQSCENELADLIDRLVSVIMFADLLMSVVYMCYCLMCCRSVVLLNAV